MENKNIVIIKHHPRPITLSNPFYLTQCPDIEERVIINLTSRGRNAEFARQVSDQVIFMANGIIEEHGAPEELFGNPKSEILRSFLSGINK